MLSGGRMVCGPGDLAERRTRGRILFRRIAVSQEGVWISKLGCIGQIEKLRPQTQTVRFPHRKDFLEGEIDIALSGSTHYSDPAVAEVLIRKAGAVGHFRSPGKGCSVEKLSRHPREERTVRRRIASSS